MSQETKVRKANRLIHETSPYLLQHAHNPVDWYPWGQEAFSKAKDENKPIFLSIGYSACHWCHVMEKESFTDQKTADVMNSLFVSIKVDREERPDLDHIYQNAAHLMHSQGGWPLSIFLTPALQPFYAGTYFPPSDSYGRPGFRKVLQLVYKAFTDDPTHVQEAAAEVTRLLSLPAGNGEIEQAGARQTNWDDTLGHHLVDDALHFLGRYYDNENGGFGSSPKFPNTANVDLFLRQRDSGHSNSYADLACHALRQMALGGIYDQLGGGFHRYSTDAQWLVPHFEKMLYDNALLPPLYLAAYQITKDPFYADIVRGVLDYVLRAMTAPQGGFYATQDADSEGEEGRYYVWRLAELEEVLGAADAALAAAYFGVTAHGNFEKGSSVLHIATRLDQLAGQCELSEDEVTHRLVEIRSKLLEHRERRVPPSRDEKILSGWNGLMISAFAKAGRVLHEDRYIAAARAGMRFVLHEMQLPGGRLGRVWIIAGGLGAQPGFLPDYMAVCLGLVDLYEATFDQTLLDHAHRLLAQCNEFFWDDANGGYFLTEATSDLIHRPKEIHDQSLPSGNALAVQALLRLAPLDDTGVYIQKADALLQALAPEMAANPWGTAALLGAVHARLHGSDEVVIVTPVTAASGKGQSGDAQSGDVQSGDSQSDDVDLGADLLAAVNELYLPELALYVINEVDKTAAAPAVWQGKKTINGETTAYVCRGRNCEAPLTSAADLRRRLSVPLEVIQ